jgi:predicted nucleic acid-binding protein
MEQYFLDTNIFLRHFLNDHPVYSPAARELLRAVEQGNVSAWTSDLVIAEIVFVLSNKQTYRLSPAQIRDLLLPVLSLPHLKLAHKKLYPRIFDLYPRNELPPRWPTSPLDQRARLPKVSAHQHSSFDSIQN